MQPSVNQKLIQCPHLDNSKHNAILDCDPLETAGIWQCQYNHTDEHEHTDYEITKIIRDYYDPNNSHGHRQEHFYVYVCGGVDGCGVLIEDEYPEES